MRKLFGSAIVGLLCLIASGNLLIADIITFDVNIDVDKGLSLRLHHIDYFPTGVSVFTGSYSFSYGTENNPGLGPIGFCIEMQLASMGTHDYSRMKLREGPAQAGPDGSPMGVQKASFIEAFWAQNFHKVINDVTAAAFQLAVWEIVYEEPLSWDVTTGSIYTTGGGAAGNHARNMAMLWLNEFDPDGPSRRLVAITNADYQDFVVTTPIPGSLLLVGIGLGAFAFLKRTRSARQ